MPGQVASLFNFQKEAEIAKGKGGAKPENEFNTTSLNSIQAYHRPTLGQGGATGEPIEYEVQKGDTVSSVASKYNVSSKTILWENDLSENSVLQPGDKLTILPTDGIRHKVRQGESISAIAYEYDVETETIIEENGLDSDSFIREGDWLVIPGGSPPKKIEAPSYASSQTAEDSYSSGFVYPTSGKNWGYKHAVNAVDIANNCGTPVYAAASGQITTAYSTGWHGGYGPYIKIAHSDGTETLYSHLRTLVRTSGRVEQGEQIGVMGNKGNSTGCHLHFEVRGARNPFLGPTKWVEALTTE